MKIPFVDLKDQYDSLKEEIDEAVFGTLSESWFVGGAHVDEFERLFADYLGVHHCIGCGNGTDALEITLKALDLGPGDEVIVPANSWISTAEAVTAVGATPVFVDVLEEELNIDPECLPKAISERTKCILVVHLTGRPARMEPIMSIARDQGILVVEDCAQAHGAAINDKKVGTFGIVGTFSFYPTKNLGAYGDGGCMVTNDPQLAEKLRRISNHGQLSRHDHQFPGRNSRLDSLQAAVLKVKLPYLETWNAKRNEIARWYDDLLLETIRRPSDLPGYLQVFHLYFIQTERRDQLEEFLKEKGIITQIHYPNAIPFTQAYRHLGYTKDQLPKAYSLSQQILSLPMYPELTREQVETVSDSVNTFLAT